MIVPYLSARSMKLRDRFAGSISNALPMNGRPGGLGSCTAMILSIKAGQTRLELYRGYS